ncbi:MAG TPA: hypothetical protein VFQ60_00570 [Patescibacteria group bacterium]|nr:hypothetical protein [Patescibacteria group bacterium]
MTPQDKRDVIVGIQEVLEPRFCELSEAIHDLSTQMDERFCRVDERFNGVDKRLDSLDARVAGLEFRMTRAESQIVTKGYLDRKLGSLWGNTGAFVRKEARKS